MQKYLKALKWAIIGGIFLSPFIVFVVSESMLFPFITGKNFAFRILTEIIFGLWLILAIFDKKYRPKKTWVLVAVSAFAAALIISTATSVNPYRSFWSNYERMEGLVAFLHLVAYFFTLGSVMDSERLWRWFFNISLGVSAIMSVYGLAQWLGAANIHQSANRLDATLGNSAYLAIYMVLHFFLALLMFLKTKEGYRWIYPPLMLAQFLVAYNTQTRGALLGLVGGSVLFAIMTAIFAESKKIKIAAAGALIVLLVMIGSFFAFKNSDFVTKSPVLNRFASISFSERTTQSRLTIWKMSLAGLEERSLFGWGMENYNLVFNKYFEPILARQEPWFDRSHNVFVDYLIMNGIVGFLAYLGLFISGLYYLWVWKGRKNFINLESAVFLAMFVAYSIHNFFVFDNIISLIFFFGILAYLHGRVVMSGEMTDAKSLNAVAGKSKKATGDIEENLGQKTSYAFIVGLVMLAGLYFINAPGIITARDLIKTTQMWGAGTQEGLQDTLKSFREILKHDSFGNMEAREQLFRFATSMIADQRVDAEFKKEVFGFAADELKKQTMFFPGDIRPMIMLGSLYNRGGQYALAIDVLNKAIELSPKKQLLYFEIYVSYLNKGETDKALETMKTAFELEPDYEEARENYAVAAIFAGKDALAEELMKDYGGIEQADQRFVSAFVSKKQYDKAAIGLEKMIANDPGNFQYRVNLAAAYEQLGRKLDAIAQLQFAIEINPRFKEQGEYYINDIKAGRRQ